MIDILYYIIIILYDYFNGGNNIKVFCVYCIMNIENIPKLVTKEDPYHIHKMLGILSLGHFSYRFFNLFTYRSMDFNTNYDIAFLWIHILLSATSFQFKIPKTRNQVSPMIYPEFRLHNLLFSYRSILCSLFLYYKFPITYNILVCYLTMIGADIVTYYYKDGTTMRSMQFDSNVPIESKQIITLYHSKMQVCATIYMIGNIDSAFSPLFAIQFPSFLMTLVRKNIIKRNHWHFLYGLSLMTNIFVYYSLSLDYIIFQFLTYNLFYYLRFIKRQNKYICWTIIYGFFLLYRQYPYTIIYDDIIKRIFIYIYISTTLPIFFYKEQKIVMQEVS
jgi:hypothetical protein